MSGATAARINVPDRIAKLVSEFLSPPVLAALLIVIAALADGITTTAVLSAVVAVVFTLVLPMAALIVLSRRGRLSGHYVPERSERTPVYIGTLISGGVGMLLLALLRAPSDLFVVMGGIVTGLVVVLIITLWWKISAHATVAAHVVMTLIGWLGGLWVLAVLIVPLVCWSRVRLHLHTVSQVIAGALLGTITALVWLPGLN